MNFRERAKHLTNLSQVIAKQLPMTAKWVQHLAESMESDNFTTQEILADLNDIFNSFRCEYVGTDNRKKYRESCFIEFTNLFESIIKKPGQLPRTLQGLLPAFETSNQAIENINEVYQALIAPNNQTEKRKYYALCFIYLILIEGLFDENIRILYSIEKAIAGEEVDYEKIRERSLGELKGDLAPVLFEGYNNRLRNAIAHAKFSYDEHTEKMTFRDRRNRVQPEYCEVLSIKEFIELYFGKADSVSRLIYQYLLVLAVLDLALSPQPLGRETLMGQ